MHEFCKLSAYHKSHDHSGLIRLPATVSKRLNARQSEIFTDAYVRLNSQSNLLQVFGVSLQMSRDPKKYFGFTFDEFTELVYTVEIAQ